MRLDHLLSRETVWRWPGRQALRVVFLGPVVGLAVRGPVVLLLLCWWVGVGWHAVGFRGCAPWVGPAGAAGCLVVAGCGGVGWLVVNCIADASVFVVLFVACLWLLFCVFLLVFLFVLFFWALGGCLGTRGR